MTIFLLYLLSTYSLAPQQDKVPLPVRAAFAEQYADVDPTTIEWSSQQSNFLAIFQDERGRLVKAFFSQEGQWQFTHLRLYPSQLPVLVGRYYRAQHADDDVTFLGQVNYPDGSLAYRTEWETDEAVHIREVDPQGNVLHQEQILFTEGVAW